jgi:hypothetical protein
MLAGRRGFAVLWGLLVFSLGAFVGCGGSEEARDSSVNRERTSYAGGIGEQETQPVVRRESTGEAESPVVRSVEETSQERPCPEEYADDGGTRLGDFEPPEEEVPPYEILEEKLVESDCVRAIRFLIDTPAMSKADYALIAREIKHKYQDFDAASAEFTDTAGNFSYTGVAVIFNNTRGARFVGYFHHPPSNEGYYVSAAVD